MTPSIQMPKAHLKSYSKGRALLIGVWAVLLNATFVTTMFACPQAQAQTQTQTATIASILDTQLTMVERELVSTADAMPEDRYSFAPTNGNFKGVRTFAEQIKHVAASNGVFFNSILGEPEGPMGEGANGEGATSNGPASIQTKAQIMQYLRDSFALGHKAIATINADNAFMPLKNAPERFTKTPAAVAIFACVHAMDHYGQMVEYLRDNGIVPPATANRPPHGPGGR